MGGSIALSAKDADNQHFTNFTHRFTHRCVLFLRAAKGVKCPFVDGFSKKIVVCFNCICCTTTQTAGRRAAPGRQVAGGRGGFRWPAILPGGCGQRPAASSTIARPSFVEVLKAASYTRASACAPAAAGSSAGGVQPGCVLNTSPGPEASAFVEVSRTYTRANVGAGGRLSVHFVQLPPDLPPAISRTLAQTRVPAGA